MDTFTIKNRQFLFNGEPFRILSGAMHYFRVPPEYWDDRLYKLRAMGCNTLETYTAWNLHEPRPGEFHFEGGLDLAAYLRKAAAHGLRVILRPGPYICAEWEFGGLPAWLLKDPSMRLRCAHPAYLAAVERYFQALLPQIAPLQAGRGGPLIAVQVENEYGSYGNDHTYLRRLVEMLHQDGIDCLLFTSDGWSEGLLEAGNLPELLPAVNFGSQSAQAFSRLHQYQPDAPLMCAEFWDGWFDTWGQPHHAAPAEQAAAALEEILAVGASVNFYMFHGGTNFGWMNGANLEKGQYLPTVTSYDYNAPLSECGDLTPKYHAFRQVISKYAPLPGLPLPDTSPRLALGEVALTQRAGLWENLELLSSPRLSPTPLPMEALDQAYGFILYRTQLRSVPPEAPLAIYSLHDRAQVFVDGEFVGVLERAQPEQSLLLKVPGGSARLDLLVENQGRVNYGPALLDRKGILGEVWLGRHALFQWEIYPLPLSERRRLRYETTAEALPGPAFYRGLFQVAQPADTFLSLPGWSKGVAWVNGRHLGRYWEIGPQRTLYVPGVWLRPGQNELVVFEQHQAQHNRVEFVDQPQL